MRKLLFFTFLLCLIVSAVNAQKKRTSHRSTFGRKKQPYKREWVLSLGATNFLGDLGGADQIGTNGFKDLELALTRPAFGAGMRIKVQDFFTVKNNFNFGMVRGDDKLTKEPFRSARNLNFRSPIFELSSQLEFNFLKEAKGHIYKIKGARGQKLKDRQMYLFVGTGLFYFNPQGKYIDGKWYNLRPLKTEGVKYPKISPLIAVGGGMRFAINKYWGIGFEIGLRKTFTDYIDDVSTSYPNPAIFHGDPKATYFSNPSDKNSENYCYPCIGEQRGDHTDKDAYMFAVLNVGYKMMYRKKSRSKF